MEKTLNSRIIHKHDTEFNWLKATNFIPKQGELIVYDIDENYTYQRFKIGDGTTKVNDLPFGAAQADWNENDSSSLSYVKNRTHWEEEAIVDVLTETTVTLFDDEGALTDPPLKYPEAGNTCIITWGEKDYECIAKEVDSGSGGLITFIGNASLTGGGDDTGEPFIIIFLNSEQAELMGGYYIIFGTNPEDEITYSQVAVSIKERAKIVHKVPKKFLEEPDWAANENEEGYIKNRTHYLINEKDEYLLNTTTITIDEDNLLAVTNPLFYPIVPDSKYVITWNDTEYTCVSKTIVLDEEILMLGNIGLITGGEDTGEPFIIAVPVQTRGIALTPDGKSYVAIESFEGLSSVTLSIRAAEQIVHKIPDIYLPPKTHWVDENVVVINDVTVEDGSYMFEEPLPVSLVAGAEYTVVMGGMQYKTVAQKFSEQGMSAIVLGNIAALMGTGDTGEPFVIIEYTPETAAAMQEYGGIMLLTDDESIQVGVIASEVVHKLDDKFINTPDWSAAPGQPGHIKNRTHYINETEDIILDEVTLNGLDSSFNSMVKVQFLGNAQNGVNYIVTWNGTEYTCKAYTEISNFYDQVFEYYFGNSRFIGGADTGEPFFFAKLWPSIVAQLGGTFNALLASFDGSTTATIKIVEPAGNVHKIDKIYLPDDLFADDDNESAVTSVNGKTGEVVLTAEDVNAVPITRTINGKALSADITINASDVGALPVTTEIPSIVNLVSKDYTDNTFMTKVDPVGTGSFSMNRKANSVIGPRSHTEGYDTVASGQDAHAEGNSTQATGVYAHAEGSNTFATGNGSHAEGFLTRASGTNAHAEGTETLASGMGSHAEGLNSQTGGEYSHAEGYYTRTMGSYSHAEGYATAAQGADSHSEGCKTIAYDLFSHAEGVNSETYNIVITGDVGSKIYTTKNSIHFIQIGDFIQREYQYAKILNIDINSNNEIEITVDSILADAKALVEEPVVCYRGGAVGAASHIEGCGTYTNAYYAHAEGEQTEAKGVSSHAEGSYTVAKGACSHAEGLQSMSVGEGSHAEGIGTIATGKGAHAEGSNWVNTITLSGDANAVIYSYATNDNVAYIQVGSVCHFNRAVVMVDNIDKDNHTITLSQTLSKTQRLDSVQVHINSVINATGEGSHTEGRNVIAAGDYAHAEGNETIAAGRNTHAEGWNTIADDQSAHAEGNGTMAIAHSAHAEGQRTIACGKRSHAEGQGFTSSIILSGEANSTVYTVENGVASLKNIIRYKDKYAKIIAIDKDSNTITLDNTLSNQPLSSVSTEVYRGGAFGDDAHAEGNATVADGKGSHSEGYYTNALGDFSHAEGKYSTASGESSHAEGMDARASGQYAHAEGSTTVASGEISHAEGFCTKAVSSYQHVQGKYNIEDASNKYAHIVGNGSASNVRSNAHTLDWNGNAWYQGNVYVGGTSQDDANKLLTAAEVNELINAALASITPVPGPVEATALVLPSTDGKRYRIEVIDGKLSMTEVTE